MPLTHLNEENQPKMVDIGDKQTTERIALASGRISMNKEAYDAIVNHCVKAIVNHCVKKGPVLQTAIIAGIMGAKKTSELIPMCHSIMLNGVDIDILEEETHSFKLYARVKTQAKTGVEMEVLMGVSIGLLTICDMVKAIDKSMTISDVMLEHKSGGKSGDYNAKK
ncbi:cyclic pyranopterin monophosphate synthase MoaC [Helicobacter pylori]|uniref:cyclic pyranopterin monophosphate synthase MoaC n=1 Tax=Helicobacter pylori TaxID=210 RepID=UPI0006AA2FE8|nr:cyclic pyranopterin monophosphate synthase MoaC [Helicobacter pylori]KOO65989.1 molybdenum cofactor biosynthesis protein C [Helicobacter pylori]OJZ94778.1 molybdenum cofactor biosynthesis protein C [Helicobacter pylori]OKB28682.1 molybdenum cofactor biosynthesis protein C [Helicobacter pylori]WRC83478.1 cyclic pyranopterin monophosphate synthase MoaC [Helicobacter pylori]